MKPAAERDADEFTLTLPGKFHYLALVSACVESLLTSSGLKAVDATTLYEVQLAIHEICNNIIQHAYGHEEGVIRIRFMLEMQTPRLMVELSDEGASFDMTTVADPDLAEAHEGGYGLFLARNLVDEVQYEAANGRNFWRLIKQL